MIKGTLSPVNRHVIKDGKAAAKKAEQAAAALPAPSKKTSTDDAAEAAAVADAVRVIVFVWLMFLVRSPFLRWLRGCDCAGCCVVQLVVWLLIVGGIAAGACLCVGWLFGLAVCE